MQLLEIVNGLRLKVHSAHAAQGWVGAARHVHHEISTDRRASQKKLSQAPVVCGRYFLICRTLAACVVAPSGLLRPDVVLESRVLMGKRCCSAMR